MGDFKLVTDTTADLPENFLKEQGIGCMPLTYTIDGETYGEEKEMEPGAFYERMRQGKMPVTSQVNPEKAGAYFREYLKENKEILCLSFSSGLSGTYNSVRLAAEELMEEMPDCKIRVIDTKAASMGEGLLVYKAAMMRNEGKSMEETADWIEKNALHLVHVFTVDDLNHLYRGGRVSRTEAFLGTMIGIKPVLHVDDAGHLVALDKVRGRKKSLRALVDYMAEKMGSYAAENDIVFISHGDAIEDAEAVREEVRERFGIQNFMINYVGPTIGSHSGPGTIALFFLGEKR